jgi:ABC-type transport system involved in multi-copper enzyme maturation permease subunit
MSRLLRAEWRKLVTTKLWWGMLLGAVAFTAISVFAQLATNGLKRSAELPLSTGIEQRAILASASVGYIFSMVVGIIFMTTEFRHFTSRPTFLIEPRRGRVVVAKVITGAGLGVLYGLVCSIVAVAFMVPWYSAKGITLGWAANDLYLVLLAVFGVVAIFAVVGVGIGVLIRNQITAVISALVWFLLLESLIGALSTLWTWLADIYKFLPAAAASAMTQIDAAPGRGGISLLVPWQGAIVLAAWGLVFAIAGWVTLTRRDVA